MSSRRKFHYDTPDTPREVRWRAILVVLAESTRQMSPNEIANSIEYRHGIAVRHPHGHSGKRLGGGSAISPTLRALQKRGWITWASRADGLSGTAYEITAAGRAALADMKAAT